MIPRVQLRGSWILRLEELNPAEGLYIVQVPAGKQVPTTKVLFSREAPGGA